MTSERWWTASTLEGVGQCDLGKEKAPRLGRAEEHRQFLQRSNRLSRLETRAESTPPLGRSFAGIGSYVIRG